MNRDILAGKWKEMKGRVKEQWGKITDDELDRAEERRALVGDDFVNIANSLIEFHKTPGGMSYFDSDFATWPRGDSEAIANGWNGSGFPSTVTT